MRLTRLSLTSFGPFSDVTLDLERGGPALHVVYGQNEAGKSTALRAITGLFYGIPSNTPDAHRVAPKELRVGAVLVTDGGRQLEIVRRKGRVKTLQSPLGDPIDETPLRAMLGGVGQELFSTLFGLDHEALRQGAEALLRGKGHLGETLYEAGSGVAGVAGVLGDLRSEAEALFTPLARNKPLSEALRKYAEAKKRTDHDSVSASAYEEQEQSIREARAEVVEIDAEARRLRAEIHRKRRAQKLLPLCAEREALARRRSALGTVPPLGEGARSERIEAQRQLGEATVQKERLDRDIARLEERAAVLAARVGPEVGEVLLDELKETAALYRTAADTLARERAELAVLEHDALAIARRLPPGPERRQPATLEGVEERRIDRGLFARIASLGARLNALRDQIDEREQSLSRLSMERERAVADLAALPELGGRAELERAAALAQGAGALVERARDAEDEARSLWADALSLHRALDLPSALDPLDAARLVLPAPESLAAFERDWEDLEREGRGLDDDARRLEERARRAAHELGVLLAGDEVPTDADLAHARAHRDDLLEATLRDRGDPTPLRSAVTNADALADRLRREADRVARRASLEGEQRSSQAALEAIRHQRDEIERRRGDVLTAMRALFPLDGLAVRPPPLMRALVERHRELAAKVDGAARARTRADSLGREVSALAETLRAAVAAAGVLALDEGLGLPALSAQTLAAAELARERFGERSRRQAERGEVERRIERLVVELAQAKRERAELEEAWAQAITPLHLPPATSTDEALAVLAELDALLRKVDDADKHRARVETISGEVERLAGMIGGWVRSFAPDLSGRAPGEAAAALSARLTEAQSDRLECRQVLAAKEQAEGELAEVEARLRLASARLDGLVAAAGASDPVDLERIEDRVEEARRLDDQAADLAARIAADGDGVSVEVLVGEVRGLTADELAAEIEELEQRLEEVDRERDRAHQRIGSQEAGLATMARTRGAADSALEAESELTRVAALARSYVVTKMAAALLEREVERYRAENQGPVVRRAGELFAKLTRGRYMGLRVDLGDDDEPELICARADGVEVETSGLSDGTRDQLYLALRLTTLERRLDEAEAMPLVLDDILIHFDDDRARAALEVLGELSSRIQILFFTHHHRLVELARQAVPSARLAEHVLPRAAIEPAELSQRQ